MKDSVFDLLQAEQLNKLDIRYDWKSGRFTLRAGRDWDAGTDFSQYNKRFSQATLSAADGVWYNHAQTEALFAKHGLVTHLENIKQLMRKGRHILLDCYYHAGKDIRFVNNIHNDRRGLNNRHAAVVMGGIRRHEPDEAELDVFIDGMNLGRGMTFKNVAGDVPMGGCKITVQMQPIDLNDLESVGFLAFAIDKTRNVTGPDMRFPPELADVIKQHFSLAITGGPNGPLGPTGTPTAHGAYMAIKQGARFVWGSESLAGRSIAVQGLGAVGYDLAVDFLQEGAQLIVADPDRNQVERLRAAFPQSSIQVVEPDQILFVEADIFAPAAVGGLLTADNIPDLKFKLIMGPANNVLRASSQEEEIALAEQLAARGIVYQVEWWHNIAGVMAGYEEFVHQEQASRDRLMEKVGRLCSAQTWENLTEAQKAGITPTERAYRVVEKQVYGE